MPLVLNILHNAAATVPADFQELRELTNTTVRDYHKAYYRQIG